MSLISITANRCDACGHVWVTEALLTAYRVQSHEPGRVPDDIGLPLRCAGCKSPYWNKESGGEQLVQVPRRVESVSVSRKVIPESLRSIVRSASELDGPVEDVEPERLCRNDFCGKALRAHKGKWVCFDQGCSMYGEDQGRVE
jgi:hypothetical protein